jgi:hypothetical protein
MYAPIAALALLAYHSAMLIFRVAGDAAENSAIATKVLEESLDK